MNVRILISAMLCFLLIGYGVKLQAEPTESLPVEAGVIRGKVIDAKTREPMQFVNISVRKAGTTVPLKGMVTDETGTFHIAQLPEGSYTLSISFIGYKTIEKPFTLSKQIPGVNFRNLLLQEDSQLLGEVKVTGQRSQMKFDIDKKEYKIVGIINDSRYVSDLERGTNSLGDGNNSGFILVLNQGNEHMAVPDELFDLHDQKTFYNDLRIHLKNENHLYEFDDDYDEYVKPINKKIKAILKDYNLVFYNQTKEDALNKIADGEKEYQDGLKQYQEGMDAYQNGMNQYLDGKKQYDQGYLQYQQGLKEYQSGLKQYQAGLSQYQTGYQKYQEGLKQYQAGYQTYLDYVEKVDQYDTSIQTVEAALSQFGGYEQAKNIPSDSPYYQQAQTLIASYDQLKQNESQINTLKTQLPVIKQELDQNKTVLDQMLNLYKVNNN